LELVPFVWLLLDGPVDGDEGMKPMKKIKEI
jgi:hypothetical protein